jgi:hypothetical protein
MLVSKFAICLPLNFWRPRPVLTFSKRAATPREERQDIFSFS